MKKTTILSLCFTLLMSLSVNSEETPRMQRAPDKVECNDAVRVCTYIVQNLTAKELISKINSIVFPGSILSTTDGYINAESLKKINFYIVNEELRTRFIAILPLLDVFDDFSPSSLIQLTTEIFSLSEGGLTELQAEITAASSSPAEDISDWALKAMGGGVVDLGLRVGTNFLGSVLGSSKVKEKSSRVTTVTQLIPNFANIDYTHNTNVYVSPTAGAVKDEMAGLNIKGVVSISSADNDLVLIKDYSFRYGVVKPGATTNEDRVDVLYFTNPQLYLVKGISSLLVSSVTTEKGEKSETGVLSWGKKKNEVQSKLMVVTRAESISFSTFVDDLKRFRTLDLHGKLSKVEREKLPTDEIKLEDVLSNIHPYAFITPSGNRILGFKLDPKDARLSNIDKSIEISVKSGSLLKSGGLKQKTTLKVENLMLSGLKFDDTLTTKELGQSHIKINLELKLFKSNLKVTKVLYYNPETNEFIEQ